MIVRGSVTVASNTDTPLPSAGRVGPKQEAYMRRLVVVASIAGTTSAVALEKGAGGSVVDNAATVAIGTSLSRNWTEGRDKKNPGFSMGLGVTPSIKTTGGAAATIQITYEIAILGQGS